jgi:outer membrane protein TolC
MKYAVSFALIFVLGAALPLPARARQDGQAQQPAASAAQSSRNAGSGQASPEPVKLADLLAEAERNHPALKAAARMVEAKQARVPQARALPDPQLALGYMGDFAPFRTQPGDASSYRSLGVMQEFPFPGKRDLRGKIAAKDVDAARWEIEMARRRVLAEVRLAYFELWGADRALEVTRKNKDLLEKLARITEERYKLGKGLQQDVLRAQLEVTRLNQKLTLLEQRRQTQVARLNTLLQRPLDAPLGPLAPVEKTLLAYSLEELVERGVANAPEIRQQEERIEQSQLAVRLAGREFYPDFGVGWDYQQRPGMPEMFGLRFSVSLPIFYKSKQRQMVSEAGSELAAARYQREALRTTLLFQVKEQYLAARASEELLTLYAKALVPQSTLTLEAALAAYQTGALDFLSVLNSFLGVLEYESAYYDELANFQKALARLEEITGIELVKGG